MADLNSLFGTDDSRLMKIVDPLTGDEFLTDPDPKDKDSAGKPMGIYFTSTESEACKRVIASFQNRFKKNDPSPEARRKFGLDLLVAAATGYSVMQLNGANLEFSPESVRNVLKNSPVIRKQSDEFVGADENFIQGVLVA